MANSILKNLVTILTLILIVPTMSLAQNTNEASNDNDINPIALVCTLSDQELIERLQYLREEIFTLENVSSIKKLKDGYEYIYEQPIDFSLKLVEFINLERSCCQGFKFSLQFEPEEGPISLQIHGSEKIRELLKGMIEQSELKKLL